MEPKLNLLVIRCSDIDESESFYQALGLSFVKHRHGKGAEHYAAEVEGFTFELYPTTEKFPVSIGTRIGFVVEDVDQLLVQLDDCAKVLTAATESPWGRRAVIADPDGYRIELINRC